MKAKLIAFILLVLSAVSFDVYAHIIEIDSLEQVREEFDKATPKKLAIFDLDQTLWNPAELFFNIGVDEGDGMPIANFDPSDHEFIGKIRKQTQDLARQYQQGPLVYNVKFLSALWIKTNFVPVEPNTVTMVTALQDHGAKVIALTASGAGRFGCIPSTQDWRLDHLHNMGLDFSTSFAFKELSFPEIPKKFGILETLFYHGILCAALNPKGEVLTAFLNKLDWQPETIMFFDDSKEQCESVDAAMKKRGIPTTCYWYRGAYQNKIKLDQELIQYQFDYYAKHEKFLSTVEAKDILMHEQCIRTELHQFEQLPDNLMPMHKHVFNMINQNNIYSEYGWE